MKTTSCAKFDFDTGSLTRSPCKTCRNRRKLPACIRTCELLSTVQQMLTSTVSCSQKISETETFNPIIPGRYQC